MTTNGDGRRGRTGGRLRVLAAGGGTDHSLPPGAPSARELLAANPYGLTLREIRAEVRRCAAGGWQLWEIRHRFTRREAA
ncbi:hypothetical protein [Streptomyces sp. YIM 98790]|uniref:hypothetical protein n=1 Tax=Streptomyces sp. YIM 98790 TaxID=2689077 RepID=UPI0014072654|nr:hypothetical protein [Streptomyces sp. YIM 98790]